MKKRNTILIVIAVLVFNPITLLVLSFGIVHRSNTHPETGENVPSVAWLPQTATNISYYKTYSWTAYEFDTDEKTFRSWAAKRKLKEINDIKRIERYSYWNFIKMHSTDSWSVESQHVAAIKAGLYDEVRQDNGGGYKVGFDREHQRAYFQANPR